MLILFFHFPLYSSNQTSSQGWRMIITLAQSCHPGGGIAFGCVLVIFAGKSAIGFQIAGLSSNRSSLLENQQSSCQIGVCLFSYAEASNQTSSQGWRMIITLAQSCHPGGGIAFGCVLVIFAGKSAIGFQIAGLSSNRSSLLENQQSSCQIGVCLFSYAEASNQTSSQGWRMIITLAQSCHPGGGIAFGCVLVIFAGKSAIGFQIAGLSSNRSSLLENQQSSCQIGVCLFSYAEASNQTSSQGWRMIITLAQSCHPGGGIAFGCVLVIFAGKSAIGFQIAGLSSNRSSLLENQQSSCQIGVCLFSYAEASNQTSSQGWRMIITLAQSCHPGGGIAFGCVLVIFAGKSAIGFQIAGLSSNRSSLLENQQSSCQIGVCLFSYAEASNQTSSQGWRMIITLAQSCHPGGGIVKHTGQSNGGLSISNVFISTANTTEKIALLYDQGDSKNCWAPNIVGCQIQ
ncbi:uncharacterized protein LOC129743870 [Uranotaenia lowii]|uniref:uncharacterized protein LOC129743870 n=1 Tax=Uranotaenia lowii TaxID=190385 RepID=UPI00247B08F5|nr:uncharacterized protein LOC129743870 [Uranotaenia lowii]